MSTVYFYITPLQHEILRDVEFASATVFKKKWLASLNPWKPVIKNHMIGEKDYTGYIESIIPHVEGTIEIGGENQIVVKDKDNKIFTSFLDVDKHIKNKVPLQIDGINIIVSVKRDAWLSSIMKKMGF